MIGVYAIKNIKTGYVYIKSSRDTWKNYKIQISILRRGNHYCKHLQDDYNLMGESCFKYVMLAKCDAWNYKNKEKQIRAHTKLVYSSVSRNMQDDNVFTRLKRIAIKKNMATPKLVERIVSDWLQLHERDVTDNAKKI